MSNYATEIDLKNATRMDTLDFAKNTQNPKRNEAKKDILSITNLHTTTTALNAKTNEVKIKMPNISNLATATAVSAVENEVPNISNLVKK